MRKPTHADAELLLHLYEIRRDPELRAARAWIISKYKAVPWSVMKKDYLSGSQEDRWFRMATSYWEMVATLVNRGVMHAELFFDHSGEAVVTWDRIKMVVPELRAAIRPTYLLNMERMVEAHLAYRKRTIAALAKRTSPTRRAKPRPARKAGR